MIEPAETEHRTRLLVLAEASPWLPDALHAVRELGLPAWCIGAGSIRNLVWDALHGRPSPPPPRDVDVAYFDASDLSEERDRGLRLRLEAILPGLPWEVTNQASVHLWYGRPVPPLTSL